MAAFFKPIFTFVTGQVDVFENPIYDYILMTAILAIAFSGAFFLVGQLYDNDIISGSLAGSICHWILRFVIFFALVYVSRLVVSICIALGSIPIWVWILIGIVLLIAVPKICKKVF